MQGQVRCLRADVEEQLKIKLSAGHPFFTWAARHAAWALARCQPHVGGATPHAKARGYNYRGAVCRLSERVLAMIPDERAAGSSILPKFADSRRPGVWLGQTEVSDEHPVFVDGAVNRAGCGRTCLV